MGEVPVQDSSAVVPAKAATPEDDAMRGEYTWTVAFPPTGEGMKSYSEKFEIGTHLW